MAATNTHLKGSDPQSVGYYYTFRLHKNIEHFSKEEILTLNIVVQRSRNPKMNGRGDSLR
jgi:hypothetical protein